MIEYVEWGQFIDIEDFNYNLNEYEEIYKDKIIQEQIIQEQIIQEQIIIKELNYKQNIFIKYFNEIISFIATIRYF